MIKTNCSLYKLPQHSSLFLQNHTTLLPLIYTNSNFKATMETNIRHSCLKLDFPSSSGTEPVFVKATWYSSRFDLYISDGLHAWTLHATEDEVRERASQWDQPVSEYIELAERYLGFQQPGSVYGFSDAGNGHKRLSWTFEKEGTKLEWRWKCLQSPDSKRTTREIMDFLMDANIRLSEEVVIKTQSCDKLKEEAEKCLAQSEKFSAEKTEFENAIYLKFLGVLNAKKSKLRKLRDQLSNPENLGKSPEEEEEEDGASTDKTQTYNGESDEVRSEEQEESSKIHVGTSKELSRSSRRGRKRK